MLREYLLGLDEVSSELNKGYDKGLKNDNIAYFAKLLKVKTMRVWLNLDEIIKVDENDKIEYIYDGLIRLNDYLSKMKEAGVERFSLLIWGFVYPFRYLASDKFVVPDPIIENDAYLRFLKVNSDAIYEIARDFTDIQYFEPTNEPEDGTSNIHRNLNTFTKEEKAFEFKTVEKIVLDLCRSISKGCKKANKNNKVVMPGFMNIDSTPSYVDDLYTLIESGTCPSFGKKSSNIEDYFDVMNWHPYNMKDSDINDYWLSTIENIRNVMLKHNDINRTIWFNEIGWSDLRRETEFEVIAKRYKDLINVLQLKLPFVETIFPFRLFTLATRSEEEGCDNFGLVYNEYDWDTPLLPKPSFIELYKAVNGDEASIEPCYKLARVKTREVFRSKNENLENAKYKVLFIGNAITYRKEASWLGLNEGRGLGSSSIKKDFVHIVSENLENKYGKIGLTLVDAYAFEKTFNNDVVFNELVKFAENMPDLTVIFIGDNFGNALLNDLDIGDVYSKLISALKEKTSRIICVLPLGSSEIVKDKLKDSCRKNKVEIVDVSDLKNDNSYILTKNPYSNNLLKIIPNDLGHKMIAQKIIEKL